MWEEQSPGNLHYRRRCGLPGRQSTEPWQSTKTYRPTSTGTTMARQAERFYNRNPGFQKGGYRIGANSMAYQAERS
jgi:hypothetical protein